MYAVANSRNRADAVVTHAIAVHVRSSNRRGRISRATAGPQRGRLNGVESSPNEPLAGSGNEYVRHFPGLGTVTSCNPFRDLGCVF